MKEEQKHEGIILAAIDYEENSKILYVLTETGKKNLLVKRAKNIKKGSMETQNLTKITYQSLDKSLAKPKNLEAIDYYFQIKDDLKKMSVAGYASELVYRFLDSDLEALRLYRMIIAFLEELKKRTDLKMLLLQFRIKMLYFLGIQPEFKRCVHCGTTNYLMGMSLKYGGMECQTHKSIDNLDYDASQIIYRLYLDKSFSLTIDDLKVLDYLSKIIDEYYEIHFHERLKSVKILKNFDLY